MGKSRLNPALGSLRGQVSGFVYRKLDGEIVVSGRPDPRGKVGYKDRSRAQDRFDDAVSYAKAVCRDERREIYARLARQRRVSVARLFSFIVGDFLNPPQVTEIRIRDYHRRAGDRIVVFAKDDCEVTAVDVALKDPAGVVRESGPALSTPLGWKYVAQTDLPADLPLTVVATAHDRAGNRTTAEQIVPVTLDRV